MRDYSRRPPVSRHAEPRNRPPPDPALAAFNGYDEVRGGRVVLVGRRSVHQPVRRGGAESAGGDTRQIYKNANNVRVWLGVEEEKGVGMAR